MRDTSGWVWERELEQWIAPFLEVFGHKAQRRWAPVYLRGLLGPGDRSRSVSLPCGCAWPMGRLKQFRRIATRFEKRARHFLAMLNLSAILMWL